MLDMAKIEIGDKKYTLRFPLKTMLKAEKMLGKPLQKVFLRSVQRDVNGKVISFPDFELEELVVLFKLGMKADQPEIEDDKAEEILSKFLSEGKSLVEQTGLLYVLLGKALGFFRTEIDIQGTLKAKLEEAGSAE